MSLACGSHYQEANEAEFFFVCQTIWQPKNLVISKLTAGVIFKAKDNDIHFFVRLYVFYFSICAPDSALSISKERVTNICIGTK